MNDSQIEAVAVADAHTSNSALPAYSEIVEMLKQMERWMSGYGTTSKVEMRERIRAILEKLQ